MNLIRITLFLFAFLMFTANASAFEIEQVDIYVHENGDASLCIKYSLSFVEKCIDIFKITDYNNKVKERFSTGDGSSISIEVDTSRTDIDKKVVWLKWSDFANVGDGKFSTPQVALANSKTIQKKAYVIFPDRGYYGFTNGRIDSIRHAIDPSNLIPLQKSYGNSLDVNFWNEKGNEHLQSFKLSQYGFDPTKMAIDVAAEVAGAGYYDATATAFKSAVAISYAMDDWFSAFDIASTDSNSGITNTNYVKIQTLIEDGEYDTALGQIDLAINNLAKSKENYETRKQEFRDRAFSETKTKTIDSRKIETQSFLAEKGATYEFNVPLENKDDYILLFLQNDIELDGRDADGKYKVSISLESIFGDEKFTEEKYETTVDELNNEFRYSLYWTTNVQSNLNLDGLKDYGGYSSALSEGADSLSLNVAIIVDEPYNTKQLSNSDKYLSISSSLFGDYEEMIPKNAKEIENDKNQFLKESKKLDASIENINAIIGLLEGDKKLLNKWTNEGII